MRECKECHKQFNPIRSDQVYCSGYCRGRGNYRRRHPENFEPRVCVICKKTFTLEASGKKNYICPLCQPLHDKLVQHESYMRHRHPCPNCGSLCGSHSVMCRACRIKQNRGRTAYSFKGKPMKTSQGYIIIPAPDHPFCNGKGRMMQHRLVMETALGRHLEAEEIVHHLNGIRHDNRLENLVVAKCHSHSSWTYIKALQKRIRDLEGKLARQTLNLV